RLPDMGGKNGMGWTSSRGKRCGVIPFMMNVFEGGVECLDTLHGLPGAVVYPVFDRVLFSPGKKVNRDFPVVARVVGNYFGRVNFHAVVFRLARYLVVDHVLVPIECEGSIPFRRAVAHHGGRRTVWSETSRIPVARGGAYIVVMMSLVEMLLLIMGMGRQTQRVRELRKQFEHALAVLAPERVSVSKQGYMEADDHQVIFWYKFQVVLHEFQLIFAEAAPVAFPIPGIGVKDVVQDNKMHFPVIEGIIGRTEMGLKRFVGVFVFGRIVIHIVVAHDIVPGNAGAGDDAAVGFV